MNKRKQRIYQEIMLLARRFNAINFDDIDFEWVHIPRFDLPTGWSKPYTELLIVLPSTYPHVPPDGWYMDRHLKTRSGRKPSHYFQEKGPHNPLADKGWAWYCLHAEKATWQPKASIWRGDNLLKYVELIRAALTKIGNE